MASPPDSLSCSLGARTWISSLELRKLAKTGQPYPLSPSSELSSPVEDFRKVAACRLERLKGSYSGQGIIVSLGPELAQRLSVSEHPPLVLLTNHHIVPSLMHIRDFCLHLGSDRPIKLNGNRFTRCISCCGRDGIWNLPQHSSGDEEPICCPVGANFSMLFLSQGLVSEVLSKPELWFPVMIDLGHQDLQDTLRGNRFFLLCRDENGTIHREEIHLQPIAAEDCGTLESQVDTYRENCKLRFNDDLGVVQRWCTGAGIVYYDQQQGGKTLALLGIHTSSTLAGPEHNGITLHTIFHPLSGGSPENTIPALSQLKTACVHKQLSEQWYRNLQECLKNDGEEQLQLSMLLQILDFLLRPEPKILRLDLEEPSVLASLELLQELFSHFARFGGPMQICAEMEKALPKESQTVFQGCLRGLATQLCTLLMRAHRQNEHRVVRACFGCWLHMCSFGEPVSQVLNDGAQLSKLKNVRDDPIYSEDVVIHRLFGDIWLAYQKHLRGEMHKDAERERQRICEVMEQQMETRAEEKLCAMREEHAKEMAAIHESKEPAEAWREELQRQVESLQTELACEKEVHEQTKKQLECKIERQARVIDDKNARMVELEQQHQARRVPFPMRSQSLTGDPRAVYYPTRTRQPSLVKQELKKVFWERDISTVLSDVQLRMVIGKQFRKVNASSGCSWESLLRHLKDSVGLDMFAEKLDPLPPGDIVLNIAEAWEKKEAVPVAKFCEVAVSLGNIRVRKIMDEAYEAEVEKSYPAFADHNPEKDSNAQNI